ncbi:helix-turn-helix domain-containing protein [Taibaiella soli]|uniref:HTH araC/xylS-type domain-containing protein n=1 Tax=Taibaiella soli TaxID=1649169 RepID=A0A2W2ACT8_9BACT|nr:helix-turn-helix transcriptional regulator [Taibaiella soli]PZF73245.1 hypothetical protein DN068_08710 [Taibaiella soli]
MQEIDYYLSTNADCIRDAAETMAKVTGKSIYYKNGDIIFPADFATGKFKYHELAEGLSVLLINCTFYYPIKFVRTAVKSNDYHLLHFNLTAAPVIVNKASGRVVDIGSDWKDAVFYSSTGKGVELTPPIGAPLRLVLIIANQTWFARNFRPDPAPFPGSKLEAFGKGGAFQFTTNLNIKCLPVAEEMLTTSLAESIMPVYLKGDVLRLIAQFNMALMADKPEFERTAFETAIRVMQLKERVDQDWINWKKTKDPELPIITTAQAAKSCHTSKTTFCRLFWEIYGMQFKSYFDELRLHVAAEMLASGVKPLGVALQIGYKTMGGFAKEFKRIFNLTPVQYQGRHKPKQGK